MQLKRRHDLIPNLVETVKGYAAHEKGTFENVTKFRSQAMQATSPEDKAAAENQLTGALKSLFAVAENYPQLKASEEFTQLQGSLSQTEDTIQNARRYYNAVVRDLNTKIQSFPTNILAGMFGFQLRQFFEVAAAAVSYTHLDVYKRQPNGPLIRDNAGAFYGSTSEGGNSSCWSFGGGCGVVFKFVP